MMQLDEAQRATAVNLLTHAVPPDDIAMQALQAQARLLVDTLEPEDWRKGHADPDQVSSRGITPAVDRLMRKKALSLSQYTAATKLYQHYAFGVVGVRNARAMVASGGGSYGLGDAQLIAATHYRKTVERLGRLAKFTLPVVLLDQPIQAVADANRIRKDAAAALLRVGLDTVADYHMEAGA